MTFVPIGDLNEGSRGAELAVWDAGVMEKILLPFLSYPCVLCATNLFLWSGVSVLRFVMMDGFVIPWMNLVPLSPLKCHCVICDLPSSSHATGFSWNQCHLWVGIFSETGTCNVYSSICPSLPLMPMFWVYLSNNRCSSQCPEFPSLFLLEVLELQLIH